MATQTESDLQLDQIERKLASIQSTMEILIALRLVDAGHAKTMREGVEIARDPARALALFPES